MRYGTWNVDFSDNPDEGTTPLNVLGIFHISLTKIAGYIPAGENISQHGKWGTVEIPEAAFLTLAIAVNPLVAMVDGLLVIPNPLVIA